MPAQKHRNLQQAGLCFMPDFLLCTCEPNQVCHMHQCKIEWTGYTIPCMELMCRLSRPLHYTHAS